MKILYLNLIYPKAKNDSNLYKDLAKQLLNDGHDVTVISLNESIKKNERKDTYEKEEGIKVLRVGCGNYFNVTNKEKIKTALTLPLKLNKAIKKKLYSEKFELIIYPSFPINFRLEFLIKKLKNKYNAITYYIHRDHFPYNALDLEIIKKGIIFNYFKWEEKKLLEISDYIGCMSEENIKFILRNNKSINMKNKLHLLKNWGENIKSQDKKKECLKINNLNYNENDFVLIFGGNMGKPQGLEMMEKIIEKLKKEKNIKFLFIGRGTEKEKFKQIEKINNNLKVLDSIPREDYLEILKSCNLGIVMLNKKFKIPNFPSKTTEYLKIGLPILAAIDETTDYGVILKEEIKAGDFVIHGNVDEYCNKIKYYKEHQEKLLEMSKNGKKYYLENLQVENATKIIMNQIKK